MSVNREQFDAEALPHMEALYARAWQLSGNEADAADLLQDTYVRAYKSFSSFQPGTNARAWLFKIMYSTFVNRYRRRKRQPDALSTEELDGRFGRAVAAVDHEGAEAIRNNPAFGWREPEVKKALDALSDEFREVVILVDLNQFSYEEAAETLDCPVGTVRSRLFRARKQLFVALHAFAEERGLLKRIRADHE